MCSITVGIKSIKMMKNVMKNRMITHQALNLTILSKKRENSTGLKRGRICLTNNMKKNNNMLIAK